MSYERYLECMRRGLPYFGEYNCALQGLAVRHAFMRQLVATEILLRRFGVAPLRILEIGSWAGGSAVTWAKSLEEFNQGMGCVVCVDPWAPYGDDRHTTADVMQAVLQSDQICQLFWHNIRACGVGHLIRGIRATSQEALRGDLGNFDIIFVDGAHGYSDVRHDIERSTPLLTNGGILCGDDLELHGRQVDRDHMLAHCESDYTIDPILKLEYHPGVTRAVAECVGDVQCWEGFWAARRFAGQWHRVELMEFDQAKLTIPPHLLEGATLAQQPLGLEQVGRTPLQ